MYEAPEEAMSDNIKLAKELLSKITYKPGWKIEFVDEYELKRTGRWHPWGSTCLLRITAVWPDVTDPNGRPKPFSIEFQMTLLLYDELNERHFIEWIANRIRHVEEHEFQEWFKVDGSNVFDPHPEQKEADALRARLLQDKAV